MRNLLLAYRDHLLTSPSSEVGEYVLYAEHIEKQLLTYAQRLYHSYDAVVDIRAFLQHLHHHQSNRVHMEVAMEVERRARAILYATVRTVLVMSACMGALTQASELRISDDTRNVSESAIDLGVRFAEHELGYRFDGECKSQTAIELLSNYPETLALFNRALIVPSEDHDSRVWFTELFSTCCAKRRWRNIVKLTIDTTDFDRMDELREWYTEECHTEMPIVPMPPDTHHATHAPWKPTRVETTSELEGNYHGCVII